MLKFAICCDDSAFIEGHEKQLKILYTVYGFYQIWSELLPAFYDMSQTGL